MTDLMVHKATLDRIGRNEIRLPIRAQVLAVQMQAGHLRLWYSYADQEEADELRVFEVHGTGHRIDDSDNLRHIATAQDGPLVWHIFERVHLTGL